MFSDDWLYVIAWQMYSEWHGWTSTEWSWFTSW